MQKMHRKFFVFGMFVMFCTIFVDYLGTPAIMFQFFIQLSYTNYLFGQWEMCQLFLALHHMF